jgi:branched-chain amino acid transport system substrate-binding protein
VGGDAVSGHFFTAQFAEDKQNERLTNFMKEFKSVYGRDPGTIAALAYDSFYLAIDAVRRARSTLKTPLQRAFDRTTDFQGITGLLTLGSKGESLKSGFIKETYAGGSRFRTVIAPKGMEPQTKGH